MIVYTAVSGNDIYIGATKGNAISRRRQHRYRQRENRSNAFAGYDVYDFNFCDLTKLDSATEMYEFEKMTIDNYKKLGYNVLNLMTKNGHGSLTIDKISMTKRQYGAFVVTDKETGVDVWKGLSIRKCCADLNLKKNNVIRYLNKKRKSPKYLFNKVTA